MTDDLRELTIEDLELSVRTSELLQSLAIATLGDLLDHPRLVIPVDWPPAVARLVKAELLEVFDDLGVEYSGVIESPEPRSAASVAAGTIIERWATIRAWLEAERPAALAHFNPPASAESIAAAEATLGVELPDDYKQFLALADGQVDLAPFVGLGSLWPIARVAKAAGSMVGEDVEIPAELAGDGVRPVDYSPGWIPITCSARGRDYFCVDLEPAPGGQRGQIIEYVVDGAERPLIAPSFADLLSMYFEQIQTGEIDLDD